MWWPSEQALSNTTLLDSAAEAALGVWTQATQMNLPVVEDRRFALLAEVLVKVGEKGCEVSAAVKDVVAAENLKRMIDEAIVELSNQSDSTL
eukprot:COSAG02_NODE_54341_length_296_cov_1.294416_1_plen_91_part_10